MGRSALFEKNICQLPTAQCFAMLSETKVSENFNWNTLEDPALSPTFSSFEIYKGLGWESSLIVILSSFGTGP